MSGLYVTSLASRQLSYYFSGVASGSEDSRIALEDEEIECFGRWSGRTTDLAGLADIQLEMRSLKGNNHFVRPIINLGYDVCLVAPKQLSILYGLLPKSESKLVIEAHKRAVAEIVGTMRSVITWGTGSDLSAVGFVHQSSRSLDPHLHTHLLLANRVEVAPGALRAVDSSEMYRSVGEWSRLYRRVLAEGIYSRLGIVMIDSEFGREGTRSEVPGFPAELAALFSKRSRKVQELVSAWGTRAPSASRAASLMSRPSKVNLDSSGLRTRWQSEFLGAGFSNGQIAALVPKSRVHVRDNVGAFLAERGRRGQSNLSEMGYRRRGDGWLRVVSFEDDLYQRFMAFSLANLVGVVANGKEFLDRPVPRKPQEQALCDPVEVAVLGRTDLEVVAKLAKQHRHQNLILACDKKFCDRSAIEQHLPVVPVADFVAGRFASPGSNDLEDTGVGEACKNPPVKLREFIEGAAEILSKREVGTKLDSHLLFASRKDRDLARREIAGLLGCSFNGSGFYDSEPVWIHFLPSKRCLGSNRLGEIDAASEGIRCNVDGVPQLIPFSQLNLQTMISPLSAMTMSDARRAWGQGFTRELALNEFARVDGSLEFMELFSANEPTLTLTADEFGNRRVGAPGEFQRARIHETISIDADFWRHI